MAEAQSTRPGLVSIKCKPKFNIKPAPLQTPEQEIIVVGTPVFRAVGAMDH